MQEVRGIADGGIFGPHFWAALLGRTSGPHFWAALLGRTSEPALVKEELSIKQNMV